METKKIIFTVGGLAIFSGLAVGTYFLLKKPKTEKLDYDKEQDKPKDENKGTGATGAGSPKLELEEGAFPLKQGSKNKLVQNLQKALNGKYGASLVTDGAMGDLTTKAICKYVFIYCISAAPMHRTITVDNVLYNDILAGKKSSKIF
jgi:hypothetical protein